jgi:hypothetical protein
MDSAGTGGGGSAHRCDPQDLPALHSEHDCFAETVADQVGGTTQYITTYHSADGRIPPPVTSTTAPTNMTFHRRWIIEADTPVTGVRRVTVLVTLNNVNVKPSSLWCKSGFVSGKC